MKRTKIQVDSENYPEEIASFLKDADVYDSTWMRIEWSTSGGRKMIRPIVHDPLFMAQKSAPAKRADLPIVTDLIDTLKANLDHCVGMAANMIGEKKRIIVVCNGPIIMPMLNPKILSKTGEYETEEGCLSLPGVRRTKRYETIRVSWQDPSMKEHAEIISGFLAQIVQHEIDHCDGVLI